MLLEEIDIFLDHLFKEKRRVSSIFILLLADMFCRMLTHINFNPFFPFAWVFTF